MHNCTKLLTFAEESVYEKGEEPQNICVKYNFISYK